MRPSSASGDGLYGTKGYPVVPGDPAHGFTLCEPCADTGYVRGREFRVADSLAMGLPGFEVSVLHVGLWCTEKEVPEAHTAWRVARVAYEPFWSLAGDKFPGYPVSEKMLSAMDDLPVSITSSSTLPQQAPGGTLFDSPVETLHKWSMAHSDLPGWTLYHSIPGRLL